MVRGRGVSSAPHRVSTRAALEPRADQRHNPRACDASRLHVSVRSRHQLRQVLLELAVPSIGRACGRRLSASPGVIGGEPIGGDGGGELTHTPDRGAGSILRPARRMRAKLPRAKGRDRQVTPATMSADVRSHELAPIRNVVTRACSCAEVARRSRASSDRCRVRDEVLSRQHHSSDR